MKKIRKKLYIVQPGDHLYSIAMKFNTSVEKIALFNHLISPILFIGQPLMIPTESSELEAKVRQREYKPVTAYTATRPIYVNGVDINTGLYPVLNFKPEGATYPYIYVPIAEFSRVGAKVEWDPEKQVINVTSDYEQLKEKVKVLEEENDYLRSLLEVPPEQRRGNTTGNLINWGLIAKQGDWVYFSNLRDNNRLYKMRIDGTNIAKLGDEDIISLNVLDEWIYYVKRSNQSGIYKIKTDGTGKTKIGTQTTTQIIVVGNWIYYSTGNDQNKIYKIKIDGTNLTKIGEDYSSKYLNVVNDWIYYTTEADNNKIYKIRTDGTERTKVNDDISYEINVVDDWIYYDNVSAAGGLYKVRIDGTQKTKLTDSSPGNINATKDWIYYGRNALYKIRPDGSENTLLDSRNYTRLPNLADDWVFFETFFLNGPALYRMKTDGTQGQVIDVRL